MDNDELIWINFIAGDQKSLAIIAKKYYKPLLRYGLKWTIDLSEVEDLIQDIFLYLWQNRDKVNETMSVKNYLFKSLRNKIIEKHRSGLKFQLEALYTFEYSISDHTTIESEWIEIEDLNSIKSQMNTLIEGLPQREKEALYLKYYENKSLQEIADIMEVNKQSVSNFLQKALYKLRYNWKSSIYFWYFY